MGRHQLRGGWRGVQGGAGVEGEGGGGGVEGGGCGGSSLPSTLQLPCAGATRGATAANGPGNGRNGAPQAFILAEAPAWKASGVFHVFQDIIYPTNNFCVTKANYDIP